MQSIYNCKNPICSSLDAITQLSVFSHVLPGSLMNRNKVSRFCYRSDIYNRICLRSVLGRPELESLRNFCAVQIKIETLCFFATKVAICYNESSKLSLICSRSVLGRPELESLRNFCAVQIKIETVRFFATKVVICYKGCHKLSSSMITTG